MKRIGDYLLEKEMHARMAALVCAVLPIFYVPTGFLAAVIVGLVTLQKGSKSGGYVLMWVALPAIASLVLHQITPFDVLFLRCLVIWALACMLRRYQSWGLIIELMAFAGVIIVILLHWFFADITQWWIIELTKYIKEMYSAAQWKMQVKPEELVIRLAPMATGIASFFFACSVLLELLIARYWQSTLRTPGSFAKEFTRIRVGRFAAGLAVGVVMLLLLPVMPVKDAFPLILLPFFVSGLSLMHFLLQQKQSLWMLVGMLYMSLFFLPIFAVSLLAIVGFMDSWINFRRKVVAS